MVDLTPTEPNSGQAPVRIVPHDPAWTAEFRRAADQLATVIPQDWPIEHIGSTSVPGLAAKPIIDLAIRVPGLDAVDERIDTLRTIGWYPIARGPQTHRVLVRMRGDQRTHIAHFFRAEDWDTVHQRIFADWLRGHPADRDLYAEAKRSAAREAATTPCARGPWCRRSPTVPGPHEDYRRSTPGTNKAAHRPPDATPTRERRVSPVAAACGSWRGCSGIRRRRRGSRASGRRGSRCRRRGSRTPRHR